MAAPTFTPILCGNHSAHIDGTYHNGAGEVRRCFAGENIGDAYAADRDDDCGAYDAEQAYERHLEDRGYEAARAQETYEASHGVVGFIEAWHAASPDTCPCGNH